jgi:N4-gp56 family major capsid protein
LNDPKAVRRYSSMLAVDIGRTSYFNKKFIGIGPDAMTPIQALTDLQSDAGDKVNFDLSMQLKMQPIEGDQILTNNEEALKFYTDTLYIDQMRGGVNTGGRMTRKRTIHDLRAVAKKRQSEWWSRVFDELFFMYLAGARGVNTEFVFPTTYTGFANNPLQAPDAQHIMYGGAAVSKASMTSTDKMSLAVIDKCVARASMMGGGTQETPQIQPVMIDGEEHYVMVMNPWQEYDLRTNTSAGQWLDIQKALTLSEGKNNPIFKGGLGMYNNVILHSHKAGIRFSDYGASANVSAARALFMGSQAGVIAFGSPGTNLRFDWYEETRDQGNEIVISTSSIFGVKKTQFNGKDFGIIAVDTAATDPTA